MDTRPAPACTLCPLHAGARTVCVSGRFAFKAPRAAQETRSGSEGGPSPSGPDLVPTGSVGPYTGNRPRRVMIAGEAPGPDEDKAGLCFIGRAGRLLDEFLAEFLPDAEVYLTNAARCFPGHRANGGMMAPKRNELDACFAYLAKEVEEFKPDLIVPVGNIAIAQVTGMGLSEAKIGKLATVLRPSRWAGIPCFPMYHPAWVLREQTGRRAIWREHWRRLVVVLSGGENSPPPGRATTLSANSPSSNALYAELLQTNDLVCYDLETNSLDPYSSDSHYRAIGYDHKGDGTATTVIMDNPSKIHEYHKLFLKHTKGVIVHNSPFDTTWDYHHLGVIPEVIEDTLAFAFLYNEQIDKSLESLTAMFLPAMSTLKLETRDDDSIEAWARRASYDVMATRALRDKFKTLLPPDRLDLYYRAIMPGLKALCRMKSRGSRIDRPRLAKLIDEFQSELEETGRAINSALGQEINLDSPQQKAKALMSVGIDDPDRMPDHPELISTAYEVLERHQDEHPVVRLIMRYMDTAIKLRTFALPAYEGSEDGILHPGYGWGGGSGGTETGRMSARRGKKGSREFNWMNPPEWLRECVVSRFGEEGRICGADWAQLEFRILLAVAGEKEIIQLVREGLDPHAATAKQIGLPRDQAKNINYARIYGAGPSKLVRMGLSPKKAVELMETAAEMMPASTSWLAARRLEAMTTGEVRGIFPVVYHLPAAMDKSLRGEQSHALRNATNSPIQGCAGILAMWAQGRLDKLLIDGGYRSMLFSQLHDRLDVDVAPGELEDVKRLIKQVMIDEAQDLLMHYGLSVPLGIDYNIGPTMAKEKKKK